MFIYREKIMTNRKVIYSKKKIKNSLIELLEIKSITEITIKELCEHADINRGTFYTHYTNLNDLVDKLEDDVIEMIITNTDISNLQSYNYRDMFKQIFIEIKKNYDEYKLFFIKPYSAKFSRRLFDHMYDYFYFNIKEINSNFTHNEISYIFDSMTVGCFQIVCGWVENGMKEDPDKMARLVDNTLMGKYYIK